MCKRPIFVVNKLNPSIILFKEEIANLDYSNRYGFYRLSIYERDLEEKSDFIKKLLLDAKERFG